jgi:HEPN domain-containing protein
MQNEETTAGQFNVLNLKPEEISDPLLVLTDFFYDDWLPGHLERLKEWRRCILEEEYFKGIKESPADLLYFHKLNVCLIEALYILNNNGNLTNRSLSPEQLNEERLAWRDYPLNLDEAELLNPYRIIKEFFNDYSLSQYREMLYEWLEHGLSPKAANEFIDTTDLIKVYENLQKLYSAAWLIHQRSCDNPYLKVEQNRTVAAPANVYQLNSSLLSVDKALISRLVSVIIHKVPSVQVILYLGTNPQGNIYLLVLTAGSEQRQAHEISSTIEESCKEITSVTALVHHASELVNAVNDGNLFFSKALGCPVTYLSGGLLLPVAKSLNSIIVNQKAEAKWERWHQQGKDFLKGAEYYLNSGADKAALFSLHQCAECLLIAIIRAVLGYRVNSHNLSRLLSLTEMFTGDIANVFELSDQEYLRLFGILKQAYVGVRYKDTFELDTKDLDIIYPAICRLREVTQKVYEQHLLANSL